MVWTFTRASGGIEAHDGSRVRALIVKGHIGWHVNRVSRTSKGDTVQGGDRFRTLADAKEFCSNNPGVGGTTEGDPSHANDPPRR